MRPCCTKSESSFNEMLRAGDCTFLFSFAAAVLMRNILLFHAVYIVDATCPLSLPFTSSKLERVFSPTDTNTPPPTVKAKYTLWYNYHWNHEDWYTDWHSVDFAGEMGKSGLKPNNLKNTGDHYSPQIFGVKA